MVSRLVRAVVALVVAAAAFGMLMYFTLLFGGSECDRGECNWFGEFVDSNPTLSLVVALLAAVGVGLAAARPWRR